MADSNPSARAASRAEARRRARMAARGELDAAEEQHDEAEPAPSQGGGFLRRLFPAVPPLPNRPDPLADFEHAGPMRPIAVRAFLLRQNLLAWVPFGVVSFAGFFASVAYATSVLGLLGSLLSFAALIAAGWYGWQRPTLFGTAAAVIAFVGTAALILWAYASEGATVDDLGGAPAVILELTFRGTLQGAIGFVSGWYGGYLRRRNAQVNADLSKRRR